MCMFAPWLVVLEIKSEAGLGLFWGLGFNLGLVVVRFVSQNGYTKMTTFATDVLQMIL